VVVAVVVVGIIIAAFGGNDIEPSGLGVAIYVQQTKTVLFIL
jgi:hypothetical protein